MITWLGQSFFLSFISYVMVILGNGSPHVKTAGSIVEAALKRDPHELEFIQSIQEAVHALERVIAKNAQ